MRTEETWGRARREVRSSRREPLRGPAGLVVGSLLPHSLGGWVCSVSDSRHEEHHSLVIRGPHRQLVLLTVMVRMEVRTEDTKLVIALVAYKQKYPLQYKIHRSFPCNLWETGAPQELTGALSYMTGKGAKTTGLGDATATILLVPSWQTQSSMINFISVKQEWTLTLWIWCEGYFFIDISFLL